MATTDFGGTPAHTVGDLPAVGSTAPAFTLVDADLKTVDSADLSGRVVLNIFPSIGTGVCQAQLRRFNEIAGSHPETTVLNVSMDLPFAMNNFCAAEGLENVKVGSAFRSSFGTDYGVTLTDSKFEGLFVRSVVVIDADGTVSHAQVTPAIGTEPDYDAVLAALS